MRKILFTFLFLLSSIQAFSDWDKKYPQFHDGPNDGFIATRSDYAIKEKWILDVGPVAYSSPVIGEDGTLYVGTTQGELVAVNPDGTLKWKRDFLPNTIIMSSPSVGPDGNIYITANTQVDEKTYVSFLFSVTPSGVWRWSFAFPENRTTTSSPKTWGTARQSYIFVYVPDSLFIINNSGARVHEEKLTSYGNHTICGEGWNPFSWLGDVWDFITEFPWEFDPSGVSFTETFGWLDPTVAIVEARNVASPEEPILVVSGRTALVAFRWSPENLENLWSVEYGKDCSEGDILLTSSPMVNAAGLLVIGRKDGKIQGYGVESGDKLWEYDAGEEIMATPASFGRQIYAVSNGALHFLESNGELLNLFPLSAGTLASPILTASRVYLNLGRGVESFSLDLETYTLDGRFQGGLSSPTVGKDGTVYVVDWYGKMWAYPGSLCSNGTSIGPNLPRKVQLSFSKDEV
ncbi:MAG: PQQ-binding-like beta-propeller repeat protein [Chlamydiae bacterium]|nr:PQQ-binding-like beta-propeller repeat protein [Chlamydiota bacterium]MBI3266748.1 PQQ-binding-like beta-propeller repeat protein [Chlamydiota bacterium]